MTGLANYRAWWDRTRAKENARRRYEDANVLIATDFEGGNGRDIAREGDDAYALDLEPEPGEHRFSGMAYYFCFGARNKRPTPRRIRVRLRNRGMPEWAAQTRHVVTRQGDVWNQLDPWRIRPSPREERVELELDLPPATDPEPVLFFSNFHWQPYTDIRRDVDSLAAKHRALRVSVLGQSLEGRDILCLETGPQDERAPAIVMSQTPQPSESGPWGGMAAMSWLLSDNPEAVAARTTHRVSFLPCTNPDGIVHGHGVSDGQGRFPFFDAHLSVSNDPRALPEMTAVWRRVVAQRPWLFIEWHSNNLSRRPGHMLLRYEHNLIEDAARRRLWDAWEEALLQLPHTHHGNWTGPDRGMYQGTLGYAAAARLGSIACMIKHHDRFQVDAIQDHATACLRSALRLHGGTAR